MAFWNRLLACWLSLLLIVPGGAAAGLKTRVGGSPAFGLKSAADPAAQPVETHRENAPAGEDFASAVHKYLYTQGNPVNRIDPGGNEDVTSQSGVAALGNSLASQGGSALARGYGRVLISYAWTLENPGYFAVLTEVGAFGASYLPEVLESAAELSEAVDRKFSGNQQTISLGWATRGRQAEALAGQAIEEVGGKFLGGNVKGIDGFLGVDKRDVLISIKSHDVAPSSLLPTVERHLEALANLDKQRLSGTTGSGVDFVRQPRPSAGQIAIIAVPESQARTIISPQFIQSLRAAAERTRTIPIIRVIRGWTGRNR